MFLLTYAKIFSSHLSPFFSHSHKQTILTRILQEFHAILFRYTFCNSVKFQTVYIVACRVFDRLER